MENKMLAMIALFAVVLFGLSAVSAENFSLSTVSGLPSSVFAGETYLVSVNFTNSNSNFSDGVNLTFGGSGFDLPADVTSSLAVGEYVYDINLTVPSSTLGSFSRSLSVNIFNSSNLIETKSVTFSSNVPELSFCKQEGANEVGDLDISSFDISNLGEGDDDEWFLLDGIEIEVEIENTNDDDDIKDVVVELMILDLSGNDVTNDFDLNDDKIDLGKIRNDDKEVALFVIDELPIDLDEEDYRIYVRAYSEDDEENECVSQSSELDNYGSSDLYAQVGVESEFDEGIIVRNLITNLPASCGQTNIEYSFDVYNMGDSKEKKVLIRVFNSALGVDEILVLDNFKSGKKRSVSFFLDIADDLSNDFYYLDVTTFYDWDEDFLEDDLTAYGENSDDDLEENYRTRVDILNDCNSGSGFEPIINAELVSDKVVVGGEVTVRVIVTNPGQEDTFAVSVNGYNSWAELVSVEPSVLFLDAGDSGEVLVKLKPTSDGVKSFNLRVVSNDNDVLQDVSLSVNPKSSDLFEFGDLSNRWMYLLAAILIVFIIVLFILIIIFAVRRR